MDAYAKQALQSKNDIANTMEKRDSSTLKNLFFQQTEKYL